MACRTVVLGLGVLVASLHLLPVGVRGHVSLTFPPARQLPLDFLNTFWMKQPCGMPKGAVVTSLVAGQGFNATWHLGYAHQGGYRLELLDHNERKVIDLTPAEGISDFYQGHNTAQWHHIQIPSNATCQGCTIRLLRQVPEFSPNFQFISCADVDIVPKHRYVERCSGHGYYNGGRCTCYARRWGDVCQYQDECDTDFDCNGVGRCIDLGGTALPRKQCFCPETHSGLRCSLRNPLDLPTPSNLNLKKHVRVKLDERFTLYFKVLLSQSFYQDEIEFVLQINGTSYGAVGFRPSNLGHICKSWPFLPSANKVNSSPQRLKKRDTSSGAGGGFQIIKSIDETDNFALPGPNYQTIPTRSTTTSQRYSTLPDSVVQSQPQRSGNGRVVGNLNSPVYSQPSSNQIYQHDDYRFTNNVEFVELTSQPQRQTTPTASYRFKSPNPTYSTLSLPSAPINRSINNNAVKVQTTHSATVQKSQQQPQTQRPLPPSPVASPSSSSQSEWAAKDPFTPMDCSDIIIGSVRGNYHRLRDSYARGRHTPLPDSIWGGRDDLIGAAGWERYGVTTIVFRRRMDSTDGPDHSIRGDMQVIWARGQEPGEVVSVPSHQLTPGNPVISDFYTRDEVKYHGLGSQRGYLFIDFDAVRKEYHSGSYSQ